jgi:hypothetical protein
MAQAGPKIFDLFADIALNCPSVRTWHLESLSCIFTLSEQASIRESLCNSQ